MKFTVMSPHRGGIFDTPPTLVRRGLGGTAAGARQYVSWIHHHDVVRASQGSSSPRTSPGR